MWTSLGIAYGCVLWIHAFGCAGFGHGSYLPYMIYGAPFSILPVPGLLFICPIWWGWLGWTFSKQQFKAAATLLGLHTVVTAFVLIINLPAGDDLAYLHRIEGAMPAWVWTGFMLYLFGIIFSCTKTFYLFRSKNK